MDDRRDPGLISRAELEAHRTELVAEREATLVRLHRLDGALGFIEALLKQSGEDEHAEPD